MSLNKVTQITIEIQYSTGNKVRNELLLNNIDSKSNSSEKPLGLSAHVLEIKVGLGGDGGAWL